MSETLILLEVETAPPEAPPRTPGRLRRFAGRVARGVASASDWLFGAVALTVGLAVLAVIPVAQLLCFGYLLEAGARVARTGRLRAGLIGVRKASRVGSLAIGAGLFLLPLELVSSMATSAELIDPGGPAARRWRAGVVIFTVVTALHVLGACARGGRIRHFFIPFGNPVWIIRRLRRGGAYASARDATAEFVASLHLPYYFRLGLLGFLGTLAWIAVPVTMIAVGRRVPPVGFLGALGLGLIAMRLPYLQTGFAVDGRWRTLFRWKQARYQFGRAPWAFAFSLLLTLTFALPLYLLKIELIPRETAWLPGVVFLAFIFPARVLTGWAYGRSLRREEPRHWFFRWTGRLAILPVAAFYVLVVFGSQYTAWQGIWSLYEQHAFLLPVPFLVL